MGLYDRRYMRVSPEGETFSTRPVWVLIAINVAVALLGADGRFALWSTEEAFRGYQLLTAGFLHADLGHLFFNMYGLYLFGTLVVRKIRPSRFYFLYFGGLLTGNLLYLAVNFGRHGSLVGASGAVCAVMMGAALLEPERRFVIIFAPMSPVKTSTLVLGYAALEMLLEVFGARGQIAHLAHLGGFIAGYVYLKIVFGDALAWDPLRWNRRKKIFVRRETPQDAPASPVSPAELDALLDKISRDGINSLSPEEYNRLRQAREEMRRN